MRRETTFASCFHRCVSDIVLIRAFEKWVRRIDWAWDNLRFPSILMHHLFQSTWEVNHQIIAIIWCFQGCVNGEIGSCRSPSHEVIYLTSLKLRNDWRFNFTNGCHKNPRPKNFSAGYLLRDKQVVELWFPPALGECNTGILCFFYLTLPETNCSPLKIGLPNRKVVFQPSICRGYVSFREGKNPWDVIFGCQVATCFEALKSGCH